MPQTPFRTRLGAAIKAAATAMRFNGNAYGGHWIGRWGSGAFDYVSAIGDVQDNSIVAATIGWVGRTYPEAPIRIVRETAKGEEPVPGHPLAAKLKRPNPAYGYAQLMKASIASYIADGNAYWLKERTIGGDVLNYWYVPPWTMEPRWPSDGSVFISHYDYRVDGKVDRWAVEDVVHLRDEPDPRNMRKGMSRLKAAIRLIYTDNAADDYAAAILRNFGTPSVIISPGSPDGTISHEEGEYVRQSWQEKTTGENRGKAVVSLAAIKVDAPGFSPAEMDVRNLRWTSEERISAIIGIPAIVVGLGAGLEHGTYANTAQAREAAYESFLMPVQASIDDQLTAQTMFDYSDDPALSVGHDYTKVRVLQPDADKLAERAAKLFTSGMIDRAHSLAMIGEEAEPGDEGIYMLPRGASFSDGTVAEPVSPQTIPVDTEPLATPPPAATNGHRTTPVPAKEGAPA